MEDTLTTNLALKRSGGLAALGMALCYLTVFIVFGLLLSSSEGLELNDKLLFLKQNKFLVAAAYSIAYLIFGCLLVVLIQATHHIIHAKKSHLINTASLFGLIWVVLILAAGMTKIIGMDDIFELMEKDSQQVIVLYHTINTIVDSLGGGIELVGGLWMFLLSLSALKKQVFSKFLNYLGLVIGSLGILTIFHTFDVLKMAFGLTHIIWFFWIAHQLLRNEK